MRVRSVAMMWTVMLAVAEPDEGRRRVVVLLAVTLATTLTLAALARRRAELWVVVVALGWAIGLFVALRFKILS